MAWIPHRHGRVRQRTFEDLLAIDLLLDGTAGDQTIDAHFAALADAVGSVDCLCIRRGIPAGIEDHHAIGPRQR